jgi:hypothetical protein
MQVVRGLLFQRLPYKEHASPSLSIWASTPGAPGQSENNDINLTMVKYLNMLKFTGL